MSCPPHCIDQRARTHRHHGFRACTAAGLPCLHGIASRRQCREYGRTEIDGGHERHQWRSRGDGAAPSGARLGAALRGVIDGQTGYTARARNGTSRHGHDSARARFGTRACRAVPDVLPCQPPSTSTTRLNLERVVPCRSARQHASTVLARARFSSKSQTNEIT